MHTPHDHFFVASTGSLLTIVLCLSYVINFFCKFLFKSRFLHNLYNGHTILCRFREQRRNLEEDVEEIKKAGITDVMVLMQAAEFRKYRVSGLLEEYSKKGLEVHHISMEDGCVPGFSVLLEAVFRVQEVNT